MQAHHQPVRTLPQWLGAGCGQSDLEGVEGAAGLDQTITDPIQRVQPDLTEPLPLDDDPVVVPADEDVVADRDQLLRDVEQHLVGRRPPQHRQGPVGHLFQVDLHVRVQPQVGVGGADHLHGMQPPQG